MGLLKTGKVQFAETENGLNPRNSMIMESFAGTAQINQVRFSLIGWIGQSQRKVSFLDGKNSFNFTKYFFENATKFHFTIKNENRLIQQVLFRIWKRNGFT